MLSAVLGVAIASPSIELGAVRAGLWKPVTAHDRLNAGAPSTLTRDQYPIWGGADVRLDIDLPPPRVRMYTGLDTHHWHSSWSHEPFDFSPVVHQYGAEVGIVRLVGDAIRGDPTRLRFTGGAGPYYQRMTREHHEPLSGWGVQWALGMGVEVRTKSGWGAALDGRLVRREGFQKVRATVRSPGGDYNWSWTPSHAGPELRMALIAPTPEKR
mgnify:CR=1 FL=1